MIRRFRSDPYFLQKYYLINIVTLSGLIVALRNSHDVPLGWIWLLATGSLLLPNYYWMAAGGLLCFVTLKIQGITPLPTALLLGVAGIYAGALSAALMHNAAHGNFRPKWLNRPVGEICGLQQLHGFAGWQLAHLVHHQHPDDALKDPHPPLTYDFHQFVKQMPSTFKRCLDRLYEETWGSKSIWYRQTWSLMPYGIVLLRTLRITFVYMILGPRGFVFFFFPSYIAMIFLYSHFNYVTHRPHRDGFEILNLDHNAYYWAVNRAVFGIYFHKNHHLTPSSFNPMQPQRAAQ